MTTVLHPPIVERGNSCTHSSHQTTTNPSQQPWNDESEAQQSLPQDHEILRRFMAVVVSGAVWTSLKVPQGQTPSLCFSKQRKGNPKVTLELPRAIDHRCPNCEIAMARFKLTVPFTPKCLQIRFSIWTLLRTPGRFTTRPLPCVFYHKNVRSKAVFG